MKKFLFLTALIGGYFLSFAGEANQPAEVNATSVSSASSSARVYYDGPAYSSNQDGFIPSAKSSVNVYWTENDCVVNGKPNQTVFKIDGTHQMRINGRTYTMTHYVNYGGERYYFPF